MPFVKAISTISITFWYYLIFSSKTLLLEMLFPCRSTLHGRQPTQNFKIKAVQHKRGLGLHLQPWAVQCGHLCSCSLSVYIYVCLPLLEIRNIWLGSTSFISCSISTSYLCRSSVLVGEHAPHLMSLWVDGICIHASLCFVFLSIMTHSVASIYFFVSEEMYERISVFFGKLLPRSKVLLHALWLRNLLQFV